MCRRLGNFIQTQILDRFYYARTWLTDAVVWVAIRITAYEVPFVHVREKKKASNRIHSPFTLDDAGDLDGLLSLAKAQMASAVARRTTVTEKCKTLFTFNSALLALIAIFQGKAGDLDSWEKVTFYLAIVAFVVALLVLWSYFDVGSEKDVPLEQEIVPLEDANLKKFLINTNLECAADADNRTDYLVDLYRTSRFYLMTGFLLLFIVFSHHYFWQ